MQQVNRKAGTCQGEALSGELIFKSILKLRHQANSSANSFPMS
ncbi:MAG: hypothetical protein ACOYK5_04060 [Bacteroidia bacterium]